MRVKRNFALIFCVLGILLFKFAVIMVFTCLLPCGKQFSRRAGLNRHQNDCPTYNTSLRLKLERRRVISQNDRIAGSLDQRKVRISGVRFASYHTTIMLMTFYS
jgi:hypothetical protein